MPTRHHRARLTPRRGIQRIPPLPQRQQPERILGRPAIAGREGQKRPARVLQQFGPFVDGELAVPLPRPRRLRDGVRAARELGGRRHLRPADGLHPVALARPVQVAPLVDYRYRRVDRPV